MNNLTPHREDSDVQKLLSVLGISDSLRELFPEPEAGSKESDCFNIISNQVRNQGGTMILGWQIWKTPLLIEAEAHAVWKNLDGYLKDLTPKPGGVSRILFVEDHRLIYSGKQIDNVRLNISGNELVDHLIDVRKALFRVKNRGILASLHGKKFIQALSEQEKKIITAFSRLSDYLERSALSGLTIDSPCFCDRNLPYSVCHGRNFYQNIQTV